MKIKPNDNLAIAYALAAVLLWSTVATAFKLTLVHIDVIGLVWWSSVISFSVLGVWVITTGKLGDAGAHLRHSWATSLLLGAINPFVYYLVLFKAYELLPAQEAQSINYTWALVLAFLSVPILGNKLKIYDVVAGIMGYMGVLIIATHGDIASFHFESLSGVGLALLSTVLWALYWILGTKISADTTVILFINFGFGVVLMGLYLWCANYSLVLPSFDALLGIVYIGMFEMSITFVLWGRALGLASKVANVSNLIFLSPILSLVLIHYIVGEEIHRSTIVALALILAGLIIQQKNLIKS